MFIQVSGYSVSLEGFKLMQKGNEFFQLYAYEVLVIKNFMAKDLSFNQKHTLSEENQCANILPTAKGAI